MGRVRIPQSYYHNNYLVFEPTQQYDKAKSAHPDFDDVILWNSDNEITESCTGNIVVEIDDVHFVSPNRTQIIAAKRGGDGNHFFMTAK